MPKKKKAVKRKNRIKAKKRSATRAKARSKTRPAKKNKPVTPIMQYRVTSAAKPPKGPQLTQSPFSKSELGVFKKLLLELRKKIVGDIQQIEGETLNTNQKDASGDLSGYSFHMADVATDSFDRELNIGLASSEQQLLNDVDAALKKIDDNTYGICEKYGIAIAKKRLLATPYVRYCLQAQEEEEKESRRS